MKIRIRRAGPQCDAKFVVPSGLLHFVLLFSLALSLLSQQTPYNMAVMWFGRSRLRLCCLYARFILDLIGDQCLVPLHHCIALHT